MVSWLPGDGNANDIQGSNHGTLQGGATFVPGKVGQAFSFNGTDAYVRVPDNANLYPGAGPFTVDAWIKTTQMSAGNAVILAHYECANSCPNGGANSVYAMYVNGDGKLIGFLRDSAGTSQAITSAKVVADGVYHHFALVRDTTNSQMQLYVDGVVDASAPLTVTGTIKDDDGELDPFTIGAIIEGGTNHPAQLFAGEVDEVEYFNRALSASEIQAIVNADSAGKCKNRAPVARCQNVTVAAGANCTAAASINNGSFDPDGGDTITVTQSPAGPYSVGTTTVTLTVTDNHGAFSSCTSTVTVVDTTPPVVSCPVNVVAYLPLNSMNTGMVVNYPAPTATDNCTASPTITSSPGSGSIFPVGTTTVNVTAKDAANNQSSCSFTVTVRYNFSGFFQPVDNAPVVNTVNAGQAIPVKFSLSGNKGLNIFATGYPTSQPIACNSGSPTDAIAETVTAGASSLSYDATSDQYKYVWKTDKAWAGTCRRLVLKFNDGSTREALFQFK